MTKEKLKWLLARLKAMGPQEIVHRVAEQGRRRLSGKKQFGWDAFERGDGPLPLLAFSGAGDNLEKLPKDFLAQAQKVMSHGPLLLGQPFGPSSDGRRNFLLDPVSGKNWPGGTYCFDIDFRHDHSLGDVKYVFEINRLQYLQPVSAAAKLTGCSEYRDYCVMEIESWIAQNPPFTGLAWASGIELALRLISFMRVVADLGPRSFNEPLRRKIRAVLAAHVYWLDRYPSRFSSANNHLVAEHAALFIVASLWADCPHRTKIIDKARKGLEDEVRKQIYHDGVGAEQSPTYSAFTLEWLLLCRKVASGTKPQFSAAFDQRLAAGAFFLGQICDDGGQALRIGDDDEGRVVLAKSGHETDYVASVVSCVAAALGKPELMPVKVSSSLRHLVFGFPAPGQPLCPQMQVFEKGGLSVMRRRAGQRHIMLAIDHGPLGYLSIAAHGHADALAVWLHIDNQPVFIDAGTFLYHGGRAWRDHFRGTGLHNTLCLGGRNQSEISGPFNWRRKAKTQLLRAEDEQSGYVVEAQNDGYQQLFGVQHRRKVQWSDDRLELCDTLLGAMDQPHELEISYLLHPDLHAIVAEKQLEIFKDETKLLSMQSPKQCSICLAKGQENPARGWCSLRFGTKQPTTQIIFRGPANSGADYLSVLTFPPGKIIT